MSDSEGHDYEEWKDIQMAALDGVMAAVTVGGEREACPNCYIIAVIVHLVRMLEDTEGWDHDELMETIGEDYRFAVENMNVEEGFTPSKKVH